MSKELQVKSTVIDLQQLRRLLGSPSVFGTESVENYEMMISSLMKSLAPRDFVEQMLVSELNDVMWDIQRYQRNKSASIERRYREHFAQKEIREKALSERIASMANAKDDAAKATSDLDRLEVLEGVIDSVVPEVDRVAGQRPADLDYARALEIGLEFQERIDGLLNDAYARQREILGQLEAYREGLGRYSRPGVNEIEIEATTPVDEQQVPLVPEA